MSNFLVSPSENISDDLHLVYSDRTDSGESFVERCEMILRLFLERDVSKASLEVRISLSAMT